MGTEKSMDFKETFSVHWNESYLLYYKKTDFAINLPASEKKLENLFKILYNRTQQGNCRFCQTEFWQIDLWEREGNHMKKKKKTKMRRIQESNQPKPFLRFRFRVIVAFFVLCILGFLIYYMIHANFDSSIIVTK